MCLCVLGLCVLGWVFRVMTSVFVVGLFVFIGLCDCCCRVAFFDVCLRFFVRIWLCVGFVCVGFVCVGHYPQTEIRKAAYPQTELRTDQRGSYGRLEIGGNRR